MDKKTSLPENFESLKKDELIKIAKNLNVKISSSALKKDIIKKIIEENSKLNESEKNISDIKINDKPKKIKAPTKKNNLDNKKESIDKTGTNMDNNDQELNFDTKESLNALTMQKIIAIAREMNIKGYSKFNKNRLILKILEEQANQRNTVITDNVNIIDENLNSEIELGNVVEILDEKEINIESTENSQLSLGLDIENNKTEKIKAEEIKLDIKNDDFIESKDTENNQLSLGLDIEKDLNSAEIIEVKEEKIVENIVPNNSEQDINSKNKKIKAKKSKIVEEIPEDFIQLNIEEEIEKLEQENEKKLPKQEINELNSSESLIKSNVNTKEVNNILSEKNNDETLTETISKEDTIFEIIKSNLDQENLNKITIKDIKEKDKKLLSEIKDKIEDIIEKETKVEDKNIINKENDLDENKEIAKHGILKNNKENLLKPSKFTFGVPHEEFLFEDEKEIDLVSLPISKDNVVLLPVDPLNIFVYWELTEKTSKKIANLGVNEFLVKVNDVTGVLYNGENEIYSFIKKVSAKEKNTYINIEDGNKNLCIEIFFENNGKWELLGISNTIYVPRNKASQLVLDTFVVANFPEEYETKINNNLEQASTIYIKRNFVKKEPIYYNLNDYNTAEKYQLRKMITKMPVFEMTESIPNSFIEDYKMTGKPKNEVKENTFLSLPPEKLPENERYLYTETKFITELQNQEIKENELIKTENNNNIFWKDLEVDKDIYNTSYLEKYPDEKEYETYNEFLPKDIEEYIIYNEEEYKNYDQSFISQHYYEIPQEKSGKIYYEWIEENVPYRKVISWVLDSEPQIHEKIYKISWGPSWIKEYIGGSERIKYLGASERFLGASEIFIGSSEIFIESSYRLLKGIEHNYPGGSEMFLGSSELIPIGSSDKNVRYQLVSNKNNIRRFFE